MEDGSFPIIELEMILTIDEFFLYSYAAYPPLQRTLRFRFASLRAAELIRWAA